MAGIRPVEIEPCMIVDVQSSVVVLAGTPAEVAVLEPVGVAL
jgi:hypothetical protein